jgi:hypothetical protein
MPTSSVSCPRCGSGYRYSYTAKPPVAVASLIANGLCDRCYDELEAQLTSPK